jgi:hypothetical protein
MTYVAIRQFTYADAILVDQAFALLALVALILPGHVGYMLAGPQLRRRIAMAVEAELHGQRLRPESEWHLLDVSMTAHAPDTLVDVDVVSEEHVVGKPCHSMPEQ